VASASRAAWRRMTASIARQVVDEVAPHIDQHMTSVHARLDALETEVATLIGEVRELRSIAGTQVDVENQSTELLGRLLRSATDRIDELEERAERTR
jgi:tetrahydromethanopterin S-methyltransferase subunit G